MCDVICVVTEERHEMPHDSQVAEEVVTCHLWNTFEKRGPLYQFESLTTVQAVLTY